LVAGHATGRIRLGSARASLAGRRAAIGFDAAFAPLERKQALEYMLNLGDRVVTDDASGDGDGDSESDPVIFEYSDESDDAKP
jgi:hypothetical protein